MAEVPHPDELAIAALSEEFGVYKFVDFETGKEGREGKREKRNSAPSTNLPSIIIATLPLALYHILGKQIFV